VSRESLSEEKQSFNKIILEKQLLRFFVKKILDDQDFNLIKKSIIVI